MTLRRVSAGMLAAFLWAALAASAAYAAQAPPGNSEVDQYAETLPGPGGNHTVNPPGGGGGGGGGSHSSGSGGSAVSPQTQRELNRLGPAGRAAAAIANSNAPKLAPSAARHAGGGGQGNSAVRGVVDALTGSGGGGGLGALLPVILLAVAGSGIGYALVPHRA